MVAGGCSEDGQKVHVHLYSLISTEDLDIGNKYLEKDGLPDMRGGAEGTGQKSAAYCKLIQLMD